MNTGAYVELLKLVLGALFLVVAIFFAFRSIRRRGKERGLQDQARAMLADRKGGLALNLLREAETLWHLNESNPTPKSYTKDFLRLQDIVSLIAAAGDLEGREMHVQGIGSTLRDLIAMYGDRSNFLLGSSTMKGDKKKLAATLIAKLDVERVNLRRQLAEPGAAGSSAVL